MSCAPGEPCEEGVKRRRALIVLGIMGALFIALSAASFLDSRGQVVPAAVSSATLPFTRPAIFRRLPDYRNAARLLRWRPSASKFSGASHCSNAALATGHSLSSIEK